MPTIISVSNLTKSYGELIAVDNASFHVNAGEIFAFLGPNGAGKTTTIKILTTLLHRTGGEVLVAGADPATNSNDVRHNFGIIFQEQSHDDDLTCYENMEFHAVLYGIDKPTRTKRIKDMLTYVDLWERKDSLVKEFSGGMRRRMEIARGLLHHPKILFLDEPTLGLDPQTRNYIWDYIQKLSTTENMTVFFTTHYMEEAERYADRVGVIDYGKIIAIGTPTELKAQTKTSNLQDAFISLTGHQIREEKPDPHASIKRSKKMGRF
ncbi:MAG: multidrug ABC transporter ATP-binding protein [Candidatus Harrisonbacteria bacterium CG10_big_fil_rev_8_21_14_0_10_49_15]|uniref:Multidrug ABC transporter ATP-binding protein n=1 Tax=Candidatus Harrisonbacteria bacterium CG10_big_fil_rev_8_21_14_0_10_49_15 TaxID=1974587 RepID=A0A2H0UL28_9BACT|nr:MAG: multidrug ABC transporter ATP-binding protein [Candidatus Harrisonbacteria bacterium CG10_big_fil_rev_8_21_14_0_10_49_15]